MEIAAASSPAPLHFVLKGKDSLTTVHIAAFYLECNQLFLSNRTSISADVKNGKDALLYNFATPIFFMAGVFTKLHAGAAHLLKKAQTNLQRLIFR